MANTPTISPLLASSALLSDRDLLDAARAARRFPILLARLAAGDVTLTSISLLAPHLTDHNHEALLDTARHASRRDVERLVASLHAPPPDVPPIVRRMPRSADPVDGAMAVSGGNQAMQGIFLNGPDAREGQVASALPPSPAPARSAHRTVVAPLTADRYLLRMTIGAATHAKLDRARALLRHSIPNGDPAAVVDRALTVLVELLERRKTGLVSRRSIARPGANRSRGRHVPAAVKREVWSRDQGRCAFVGSHGRCAETGFLEYHHLVPYATGGATDAGNLQLRCRAHNAYEATVHFGDEHHASW